MVSVRKRGDYFEYRFEMASIDGKRKWKSQSGFRTRKEAYEAGNRKYTEYIDTGNVFTPSKKSYSDYLDYWLEQYCEINLRYRTIMTYKNIIENHIKPRLGFYMLNQLTPSLLQEFINNIYLEKEFSKAFLKNILKVIKGSLKYATDVVGLLERNPSINVKIPKFDTQHDPAHIFTEEEIKKIFARFKGRNNCIYYAFMTAYYTGLRVSEVFGLTWEDIDFENKTLSVNKIVVAKNQIGTSKHRHLSGNSTTVWYFGKCKTPSSYRTISIGDKLVNALKEYKKEQEENEKYYNDVYMKHYIKKVKNFYTNKEEIKILNAHKELNVDLPEVHLVFVKKRGIFQGTDTPKYPFKVIHYELGIHSRFHDFRDTHATRLIELGADVKAVAKRLGHSTIRTTYDVYVRVTPKMSDNLVNLFEDYAKV